MSGFEEALAIAALVAAATVATEELTKPKPGDIPSPGQDPHPKGIPDGSEAAIRARIARQRDLASLRVDAAASPRVATGIQIPNS